MPLTNNAKLILERRYLRPGETPDQMFHRVAVAVGTNEQPSIVDDFSTMMSSLDFLPNSPTLANAGTPSGQLSACFVLPVEDNMGKIFGTARDMALIHKSGGGTGFSFSRLRGDGAKVGQYGGTASGPVPFMRIFDQISQTVKQGGMRHGANMGMLRSDHPDIRRFINAKRDKVGFTNFNTSVAVTDDFMDAVIGGRPWTLRDHNGRPTETVDAPALFDDIVSSAWECGDPGLIFITRVNTTRSNPVTSLGPIEATNPCGEQPLYPYDSCNLGSINLFNHLLAFPSNDEDTFDWNRLRQTVHLAVRFLDDVIDANVYPLPEITKMAKNIRRIGLGVMGWADCLFALGIPYDSATSRDLARRVMSFISDEADNMSEELADRRDVFPLWYDSIYSGVRRLRNSTRTTIAPTGTISIIAGCSSGIEPAFALVFKRQHKLDKNDPNANTEMFETNPVLLSTIRSLSPDYVVDKIVSQLASGSHPTNIAEFPQHLVNVFATAHDISPFGHLGMQEAFQAHVDNAVSKTINLPNSATKSDVNTVYRQAYDMNLKGITIYRDGSKAGQVLSVPGALTVVATTAVTPPPTTKPARTKLPKTRDSITHKFRIGDNEGYLTVGLFPDGKPGELFIRLNREGNAISGFADGVCIATSIALQHGVPLDLFVKKYRNTKFEPSGLTDDPDIRSCTSVLDYVFRWLELRFLSASPPDAVSGDPCACGGTFIKQEGCAKCPSCGESRC